MKSAREQRASNAAKLAADSMRVGRVSYVRSGMSVNEYWERGAAWDELQLRREQLDKVWCRESERESERVSERESEREKQAERDTGQTSLCLHAHTHAFTHAVCLRACRLFCVRQGQGVWLLRVCVRGLV